MAPRTPGIWQKPLAKNLRIRYSKSWAFPMPLRLRATETYNSVIVLFECWHQPPGERKGVWIQIEAHGPHRWEAPKGDSDTEDLIDVLTDRMYEETNIKELHKKAWRYLMEYSFYYYKSPRTHFNSGHMLRVYDRCGIPPEDFEDWPSEDFKEMYLGLVDPEVSKQFRQ